MSVLTERFQKNPTALLAILLIAHMIVLSLNRIPVQPGEETRQRYFQVWLMTALTPLQWATAKVASGVGNTARRYVSLKDARIENEQLRNQLSEQNSKLVDSQEKLRLAEQLKGFGEWETTKDSVTIARVIARDADRWFASVVIDKGTIAGIQKNQPVITREGLVGRTVQVGPISSRVLLLTDERHGAGAIVGQLADSRLLGIIKGKGEARCEMKFVDPPEQVPTGELVLTSGQDGVYPRGLIIGRIKPVERKAGGGVTYEVETAASLAKLDMVSVLAVTSDKVREQVEDLMKADRKDDKEKQGRAPARQRR
jgi:rod shape-determining protein MreC